MEPLLLATFEFTDGNIGQNMLGETNLHSGLTKKFKLAKAVNNYFVFRT